MVTYWWLLVSLPILGGVSGYLYSVNQEKIYEAKTTLLVQQRRAGFEAGVSDFNLSQQLATTYGRQVESTPFLDRVASDPELDFSLKQLRNMVSASISRQPPTVDVKVTHGDPNFAYSTANILGREFIDYVLELRLAEIAKLQAAAASQGLGNVQSMVAGQFGVIDSLVVLEPASIPARPAWPKTNQNVVIGLMLGLLMASGGAFLLSSFSDTVRDPEELQKRFGILSLGAVFKWSSQEVDISELATAKAPSSGYSESFKQIRANIQFAIAGKPSGAYLVTSPGPGEGKTTIISNLAVTFSQLDKRVMLIDGDMRRPAVHRLMTKDSLREPGLSNFLSDPSLEMGDVIHPSIVDGVSVIPGGPIPPNPSELLASPRMRDLLRVATEEFDLVFLDSPPVLVVADGPVLASMSGGVIVVVDGFGTRSSSLRALIEALKASNAEIVGAVVNKLKRSRFGYRYSYPYYYDYYYYTYSQDSSRSRKSGRGRSLKRPIKWLKSVIARKSDR